MKIKILIFFFAITIFTLNSCKDKCKDVNCNTGTCVDGDCVCPDNYYGEFCEIHDPCLGKNCLNGGTCVDGTCNCPEGYTGTNCEIEVTPVSVTINSIQLNNYPMTTTGGAGWDFVDGPDIFLSINTGTTSVTTSFVSGTQQDATGQSIFYSNLFPVNLVSMGGYYTLGVWDADSPDADDFMCGIYFMPTDYKSGHPSTIHLYNSSTQMDATLNVTWNF